jgi:hypothetical protein
MRDRVTDPWDSGVKYNDRVNPVFLFHFGGLWPFVFSMYS